MPSVAAPGTILIVGYRAYDELKGCLDSLRRHEPGARVVVVDHAANPARGRRLADAYSAVTYVPIGANPGFSAGVNRAAREAGPGPLLLLNPDCEARGPLIAPLAAVLDQHLDVGIVGGVIRGPDGAIQPSARRFPDVTTAFGGRTSWLTRVAPDNPITRRNLQPMPEHEMATVDWVTGAFMMVRRESFDRLGGFDERFFLYWEDADFCRRALSHGWRTVYAPVAEVLHLTSRTTRHAPVRSLVAFHRSAFRYYLKHGSRVARLLAPFVGLGLAGRLAIRLIRRRV
jgi:hypothetical protein